MGKTTAYGQLNAGQAHTKGERHIDILKAGTAKSDYKGRIVGASLGVRHQFGTDTRHIAPFTEIAYANVSSDGYRETGTRYDLTVAKQTVDRLSQTAGVQLHYGVNDKMTLTGAIAGKYGKGNHASDISASFSNTPSASFTTFGEPAKRLSGQAKLGVDYQITPSTQVSLHHQGQGQKNWHNHGVHVGAKLIF